ncbi:Cof-type HAD-IIB family hydrolase [Nocardia sp. MDA0666]|uniref:Cof-type HAD-IIB family hydrolase n=1 Tax=Nocardia sp. MDA0666 TaxID=2135448 RepID=UPI001E3F823F|nr:HAD family hydrolase [Nocardia sp. MDA0666]
MRSGSASDELPENDGPLGGSTAPAPPSWSSIPPGDHGVRLVVCDMDGTLLTKAGTVPDTFWPLLEVMRTRAVTFVPASGRQYATLAALFERAADEVSYIAENGCLVVHSGVAVSATCLDVDIVRQVVQAVREAPGATELGLVVCGLDSAYIERTDPAFVAEAAKYYARLERVDDLTAVTDKVLKLAIYDFTDAERTAEHVFGSIAAREQVVVSGKHWIDIMSRDADKGRAVRSLQQTLGIPSARTAVFGDYLNDLEMLDAARWSFAMANAHPDVRARARYLAPADDEDGVVTVLSRLFGS